LQKEERKRVEALSQKLDDGNWAEKMYTWGVDPRLVMH
jgi:hypothetical protein